MKRISEKRDLWLGIQASRGYRGVREREEKRSCVDLMFFGEFLINTTPGERPDGPAPSPLACVGANVCMRMSGRRSNMSMAVFFLPCSMREKKLSITRERERKKRSIGGGRIRKGFRLRDLSGSHARPKWRMENKSTFSLISIKKYE